MKKRSLCPLRVALGPLFIFAVLAGMCSSVRGQGDAQVQSLYNEAKQAQAAGDLERAIAKYQQLVQIAPRLAPAYNNLGMLYVRTRQYPEAVAALKHARALDPTLASIGPLLGIAYFETGDYPDARIVLEAAVKTNPQDGNAASLLARALLRTGDLSAAVQQLQQLTEREPGNQTLWYELGQAYMQLSQQAFTKVQSINPDSVLVHEMSGQMMVDMRNYDGALVEYNKAVAMAPHEPGTHYGLAMVYWNQNNLPAALTEFRSELQNDPTNCDAHAKIGNILLEQQQADAALEEASHALSQCPGLLQARVVRGEALVQQGRNAEAIAALRDVIQYDPEDQGAHFYLARAYRATGDTQAAQAELQIYTRLEAAAREHTAAEAQEVVHAKETPQP